MATWPARLSTLGRFTSRDTIGVWGDPANLGNGYTYVGNNPHSFVDPHGENPLALLGFALAADVSTQWLANMYYGRPWCEGMTFGSLGDAALIGIGVDGIYDAYNTFSDPNSTSGERAWALGWAALDAVPMLADAIKALKNTKHAHLGIVDPNIAKMWGLEMSKVDDVAELGKTHRHHSDPKFLGGDIAQPLTIIDEKTHRQFHKDLNNFLYNRVDESGNHMRPQRGNSGDIIRGNFTREEMLGALKDFYKNDGAKYNESAEDFFKQHPELR